MTVKLFKTELRITVPFAFLVALLLTFDKTGMMSVSLIAVILHESGHLAVLYVFGRPPRKITLCIGGVNMTQTRLLDNPLSEAAVAAAGPAANLLTSLIMIPFLNRPFPAALCAAGIVIGGFNLLPLSGLDGGDILRCLLSIRLSAKSVYIITIISNIITVSIIAIVGLILLFSPSRNPTMLIAAVYLSVYVLIKRR